MISKEYFEGIIGKILSVIRENNPAHNKWSYLSSIEYMLSSRIYMEGVYKDLVFLESNFDKRIRILDFGTGIGFITVLLAAAGYQVNAIDTVVDKSIREIDRELYSSRNSDQELIWEKFRKLFPNVSYQHYDGRSLPFKKDSFDLVIAYAVLEHIPTTEIDVVLQDLWSVTKKGGYLFISQLPRKLAILEHLARLFSLGHHEKLYKEVEIKQLLKKHHLFITHLSRNGMVFAFPPKYSNFLYPLLSPLDSILTKTPLNLFAHNFTILAQKEG